MSAVYLGAFLTAESRAALLAAAPPKHANIYADHVTIAFRPAPDEVTVFADGREVELEVVSEMSDASGQAVLVHGVPSHNRYRHVTISTASNVKPVYSNDLLASPAAERRSFDPPLRLKAVLDTFPRTHTKGDPNG